MAAEIAYQDRWITLYHGRAEDVVRAHVPPDSIDLTLTDPPYDKATHSGARSNPETRRGGWASGGNAPVELIPFDAMSIPLLRAFLGLFASRTRTWVITFLDYHHILPMEQKVPRHLEFVRHGLWIKTNGAPQFTGDRPAQGFEAIGIFHRLPRTRMRWWGGGHPAVYTGPISHPAHRLIDHPTAKPAWLIGTLIEQFSAPGQTILDPFCGSGVVLSEARRRGRRAIGVELSAAYCQELTVALEHEHVAETVIQASAEPSEYHALDMFHGGSV